MGVSFVGLNALIMRRYMYEFGWKHADFAPFAINAHANAINNPYARLRKKITLEDFEKSTMIATPINLLDASPIGDGAAAVYIVPAESVLPGTRILVAASASATDTIAIHDRSDALFLAAAYQSARQAYQQAGVEPADIDVFELHDAFTIMSALSLEACGFAERGKGVQLGLDGEITPMGHIPVCSRRAGIPLARPGSTRSSRWCSSCAGFAAKPRSRKRASAWRRILADRVPPSSRTS